MRIPSRQSAHPRIIIALSSAVFVSSGFDIGRVREITHNTYGSIVRVASDRMEYVASYRREMSAYSSSPSIEDVLSARGVGMYTIIAATR